MSSRFIPRAKFPEPDSLIRSYYLGHHAKGLGNIKNLLSSIDLTIEVRDSRVPISSRNPLFEEALKGKNRLVVYNKRDLVSESNRIGLEENIIRGLHHHPSPVLFTNRKDLPSVRRVLRFARDHARSAMSLTGSRMMVVGMPNVGKSSLLNTLRMVGVGKARAAQVGDQPGVTRKIGTTVKIIEPEDGHAGVYLVDTPGVFMPYLADGEAMLKLALCGSVKDTIISPSIVADYLLYHLNLHETSVYSDYSPPTNDVMVFLDGVARRTGRLQKGGVADTEAAALWVIQQWRIGRLGRFMLDDITVQSVAQDNESVYGLGGSISHARRMDKDMRRQRSKQKHLDSG